MEAAIKFRRSGLSHIYLKTFIYVVIYGCAGSSLLHASFLWLQQAGAILRCGGQTSHCSVFFCGALAQSTDASVVVHGHSCLAACEVFPDQGSSWCPLHCKADSQLCIFNHCMVSTYIACPVIFFFNYKVSKKYSYNPAWGMCVCVCVCILPTWTHTSRERLADSKVWLMEVILIILIGNTVGWEYWMRWRRETFKICSK